MEQTTGIGPLHTERLTLRPPIADDIKPFVAMCADPRVMRYVADGRALTRPDAELRFWILCERFGDDATGLYTVVDGDTGTYLGFCGTVAVPPSRLPGNEVELGWRLVHEAWGRGLATEAARAVFADVVRRQAHARLVALIREANTASVRVATKVGMQLDSTGLDEARRPFVVYAADCSTSS